MDQSERKRNAGSEMDPKFMIISKNMLNLLSERVVEFLTVLISVHIGQSH